MAEPEESKRSSAAATSGAGAEAGDRAAVLAAITTQIGWCRMLDAPFTAGLLELVRANVAAGGALAALTVPWPGRPLADALPIRLAGAFHALARSGRVPALVAVYSAASRTTPTAPAPDATVWGTAEAAALVGDVARAERDAIAAFVAHPPQTNEVGRSAILMPGYAEVARATGLPLRVLELGASAGLNLNWDRYGYRLGEGVVGPTDASLVLAPEWRGPAPYVTALPAVAARRGCDLSPIDLAAPGATERLLAYVWPDHPERVHRLEAAIAVARALPPPLDAADAGEWLAARLAEADEDGVATVVSHTIAWQYFAPATAERARRALDEAAGVATVARPLAWLDFEHRRADAPPDLELTLWPGGTRRVLARAHPHGNWIEWLA